MLTLLASLQLLHYAVLGVPFKLPSTFVDAACCLIAQLAVLCALDMYHTCET